MDVLWRALTHQPPSGYDRCIRIPLGGHRVAVCSRCLGLYPLLVATLAFQLALPRRWHGPQALDPWLILVGSLPALLDWGAGRLGRAGSNPLRAMTGAMLGVAVGRSLIRYFRDPLDELFWSQAALLIVGALLFELARAVRPADH